MTRPTELLFDNSGKNGHECPRCKRHWGNRGCFTADSGWECREHENPCPECAGQESSDAVYLDDFEHWVREVRNEQSK